VNDFVDVKKLRMTKNKKSTGADEMLRQNVFSSMHMSTRLKSEVVQLVEPVCSMCGVNKGPSKKKTRSYHFSVYTNCSEPFVVWFKKSEEPKGMLLLRTFNIRRSSTEANVLELVSKTCHFKCAYKIKLSSSNKVGEWYQLLKDESRKQPTIGGDLSDDSFLLDSIFDDASHKSFYSEDIIEEDSKLADDLVESDTETVSLSSSVESDDKLSCSDYSIGSTSPTQQCTNLLSYIKGSKSRSYTTSALPHLKVREAKKTKSSSVLPSPQLKTVPISPHMQRKLASGEDNERWSWPSHNH